MDICIIGLGYIGVPLATLFAESGYNVLGYDIDSEKIDKYKNGIDVTNEVGDRIKNKNLSFSSVESDIQSFKTYIICVPTPINSNKKPDNRNINSIKKLMRKILKPGDHIIIESSVTPGTTLSFGSYLEFTKDFKIGKDFHVSFSSERVAPATERKLEDIVKVVSSLDPIGLRKVSDLYRAIIKAGIYQAKSTCVAESAKMLENIQIDVNIALMNEMSVLFNSLGLNTNDIIDTADSKWSFKKYVPGLVGGHCIGVDPYYMLDLAKDMNVNLPITSSARRVNDSVPSEILYQIKKMIGKLEGKKIGLLGLTFKENCNDIRNSLSKVIFESLMEEGAEVLVNDPTLDRETIIKEYGVYPSYLNQMINLDVVIVAVKHNEYYHFNFEQFDGCKIFDLKNIFDESLTHYRL